MNKQIFGIMLASTLSLSALVGCNGATPIGTTQSSANASSDSGAETASTFSEERSMDDYAARFGDLAAGEFDSPHFRLGVSPVSR